MALSIGDKDATRGMTKVIFDAMDAELRPPMEQSLRDTGSPEDEIQKAVIKAQANWRQLSFVIASGLVSSLRRDPPPSPADPVFGEAFSSRVEDAVFWDWLKGFVGVFQSWAPTTADGVNLKNAINSYLSGKPVPEQLRGILQ